jgi:peroxiredoxin
MRSLQEQLDGITAMTRELVPAERLEVSERAIEALFATGIEERILGVGERAPEFELESNNGHRVRSADLLALGPLVVKFFRGRWCAYDVTELEAWRDLHGRVRAAGAFLVGVSPQTKAQNDFFAAQHRLPFPLLGDEGAALAESFHLAYTIPEHLREYYLSILVNIPYINGEPSWRLPLPATYAIGQDGKVLFAEAHADYRVRPEPEDVLAALEQQ